MDQSDCDNVRDTFEKIVEVEAEQSYLRGGMEKGDAGQNHAESDATGFDLDGNLAGSD